jgi:hypothetical protein
MDVGISQLAVDAALQFDQRTSSESSADDALAESRRASCIRDVPIVNSSSGRRGLLADL